MQQTSTLLPGEAVFRHVIKAGDYWIDTLRRGQALRIVDVEGNQAADTLFFNAADVADRYSAVDTIREQGNVYLGLGSKLLSTSGKVLAEIAADTVGRHDTLAGNCSREINLVRYGKPGQLSCRDNFIMALSELGMGPRDIPANINFFMNVPVNGNGDVAIADGISEPWDYVDLRCEKDVIVVISNCPQELNPCSGGTPTPIRLTVWRPRP